VYARIKPLLDPEGILSLTGLSSEELIRRAEVYRKRLCELTGAVKSYPTVSGRTALSLALRSLGIGPGDEVVIPALTCPAVADAVLSLGAVPHLCDISPRTLSIRPNSLRRILSKKRAKAVVDAPLLGVVPRMEETAKVCSVAGVPLIVDVAQSFSCKRLGKSLASYGVMAVLSTNVDKPFTTGRGGALLVMDRGYIGNVDGNYLPFETQKNSEGINILKGLAVSYKMFSRENYKRFASINLGFAYAAAEGDAYELEDLLLTEVSDKAAGKIKTSAEKLRPVENLSLWDRFKRRFWPSTAVPEVGRGSKLSPILSSVGALHIEYLEKERERRRELAGLIERELTGYPAVEAAYWESGEDDEAWPLRYPLLLNDYRDKVNVVTRCFRAGYEVGGFVYPRPLSGQFPYFKLSRYSGRYLRGAWRVAAGMINLPLHSEITADDAKRMSRAIKR
jgi:dTDP-4-amino-4,6-dideoxygalactose transaminase